MRRSTFSIALLSCALLASTGCRQPDGQPPQLVEDMPNRIYDMGRDLLAVASGDASGPRDFAEDLRSFAVSPAAADAADTLAARISDAVKGQKLTDQAAQQIAHTGWTIAAGRDLSDRQAKSAQDELRNQLTTLGSTPVTVDAAVAAAEATHAAVTARPRRWYELF